MGFGADGVLLHHVLESVDGVFYKEHENATTHLHVAKEKNVLEIQWKENYVENKDAVALVSIFANLIYDFCILKIEMR